MPEKAAHLLENAGDVQRAADIHVEALAERAEQYRSADLSTDAAFLAAMQVPGYSR